MGAGIGVSLNLDVVPLKDESLTAWEILLSESQERMLIAVPAEKLSEAKSLLDHYEVSYTVIGHFTDSKRLEAFWRGQRVVNLEMDFLWGACPIDPIPSAEPRRTPAAVSLREPHSVEEWSDAMRRVLGHYHCADQSAAGARFDSTVQGRTVVGPYGGKNHQMPTGIFVAAPLLGQTYGLITTLAFNPFYGEVNPVLMAKLMVIEAVTKAVVAGADYREIALCDNFYTPRVRPEIAWELTRMVENIAALSCGLGTPFISGKDSSSGTFEAGEGQIDVPPTLAVASLGRIKDARLTVTKEFKRAGNRILLVGQIDSAALGGTVYADAYGQRGARLFDGYNADTLRTLWDSLLKLHDAGAYFSGSAIAEGGLALRVFEAAFGSGLGARLNLDAFEKTQSAISGPEMKVRRDGLLFGEFIGSVLLEVAPEFEPATLLPDVSSTVIGEVISAPNLVLSAGEKTVWQEEVSTLAQVWSKTFREVLE
jgi:phosphoribosylformylglycinamidine synthase subunit PurSL